MLLLSQDRTLVLNLDSAESIHVYSNQIGVDSNHGSVYRVAIYENEELAKKALKIITEEVASKRSVIYMPKLEE